MSVKARLNATHYRKNFENPSRQFWDIDKNVLGGLSVIVTLTFDLLKFWLVGHHPQVLGTIVLKFGAIRTSGYRATTCNGRTDRQTDCVTLPPGWVTHRTSPPAIHGIGLPLLPAAAAPRRYRTPSPPSRPKRFQFFNWNRKKHWREHLLRTVLTLTPNFSKFSDFKNFHKSMQNGGDAEKSSVCLSVRGKL